MCSIIVLLRCEMTSESVFFFHCKDLGRRSEKAAHIITEPPSLKEAFVLVMWVFFVFQPLREKNCVAALIWLGQEPQLDSSSHWTGKKNSFYVVFMFHLFLFHYSAPVLMLLSFFFRLSTAYRTPSGKTHPGLYFWRRKQMWGCLSSFKCSQNLTRTKWVYFL